MDDFGILEPPACSCEDGVGMVGYHHTISLSPDSCAPDSLSPVQSILSWLGVQPGGQPPDAFSIDSHLWGPWQENMLFSFFLVLLCS